MVVADELLLVVNANTTQAVAGLGAVENKIGRVGRAGQKMSAFGMNMTKFATLPILGVVAASIKAASSFDKGMTNSLAIMEGVTGSLRKEMEITARQIAGNYTISAVEAAEAYFFLASAGMDAVSAMKALPAVAAFAQAGNFDMSKATDLATDALSAMGLAVRDDAEKNLINLVRVTDVLTRANTLANASVEQFAEALINKAAPALTSVGKSIEEGTAVLAVFADKGIKGRLAGQRLAQVLDALQIKADENAGAFRKYGIEVFDSNGKMNNMADIVEDLTNAFGPMSDAQQVAALTQLGFGIKTQGVVKSLLGEEEAIRIYQLALEEAMGYTATVATAQLTGFEAQMTILKNRFVNVGIILGSVLLPRIVELTTIMGPALDKWTLWLELNTDLALAILGVTAAIGPVMLIVMNLIRVFTLFATPVGLIFLAIGAVVGIAAAMGVTLDDVKEVFIILGEKIQDVIGWLDDMGFNMDNVMSILVPYGEILKDVGNWMGGVVSEGQLMNSFFKDLPEPMQDLILEANQLRETFVTDVFPSIMESLGTLRDSWDEHWPRIRGVGEQAGETFSTVWGDVAAFVMPLIGDMATFFSEQFSAISTWVSDNMDLILDSIEKVLGLIETVWNEVWPAIERVLWNIWENIKNIIETAINVALALITLVLSIFTGDWDKAWEAIKTIVTTIWDGLWAALFIAWEGFLASWDLVWAAFMLVWETAWGVLGEAASGIWGAITTVVKGAFHGVMNFIIDNINTVIDMINSTIRFVNGISIFGFSTNIAEVTRLERVGIKPKFDSSRFEDFFPGAASGGNILRGGTVKVGEGGPELLNVPTGASITPNESIGGAGGPMIGQVVVQSTDPNEIARALAWEMRISGV